MGGGFMATKLYNTHLNTLINNINCREYYIYDTYIALVHLSSEINNKYLIQTYNKSISNLASILNKYIKTTHKTLHNCINKLIELDIIAYDNNLDSWIILGMENMTKSKSDEGNSDTNEKLLTGYTNIRNFFLSEDFSKMKAREKRILIYMAQLRDSKASKNFNGIEMNLLKPNNSWLKVIRTSSKYYAKYTIEKMLNKYSFIFNDTSETLRNTDLSLNKKKTFKFSFECEILEKIKSEENEMFELVKIKNPNEYNFVMNKIRTSNISLTKSKIMHLIRAISHLREWFLKERIVQIIVNKYIAIQIHKSRKDISSLPAYLISVVKSVIEEYKYFRDLFKNQITTKSEIGENYINFANNISENIIDENIKLSEKIINT